MGMFDLFGLASDLVGLIVGTETQKQENEKTNEANKEMTEKTNEANERMNTETNETNKAIAEATNTKNAEITESVNATNKEIAEATNLANKEIQEKTNATNKEIAEQNLLFQKQQQEYEEALQERIFEREDTSYQRTVEDMKKAGLNPLSMSGTNGSGGVVGRTTSNNTYQEQAYTEQGYNAQGYTEEGYSAQKSNNIMSEIRSANIGGQLQQGIMEMANSLMNVESKDAQNEYTKAQALKTEAEAERIMNDTWSDKEKAEWEAKQAEITRNFEREMKDNEYYRNADEKEKERIFNEKMAEEERKFKNEQAEKTRDYDREETEKTREYDREKAQSDTTIKQAQLEETVRHNKASEGGKIGSVVTGSKKVLEELGMTGAYEDAKKMVGTSIKNALSEEEKLKRKMAKEQKKKQKKTKK